jgi:hypothetical protein
VSLADRSTADAGTPYKALTGWNPRIRNQQKQLSDESELVAPDESPYSENESTSSRTRRTIRWGRDHRDKAISKRKTGSPSTNAKCTPSYHVSPNKHLSDESAPSIYRINRIRVSPGKASVA